MSLDQQVALSRPVRGESSHLSRAARQVVPPFLQKLYEIVNDPRNDELIRWSESGDSFFVLNHERFAREVLGRWFKHQKFTSFVRQLNMYGFHKIPHLQQGVLKSDSDTEPWNFEHPHFHRGQPDLLCLIQRKKQPANNNNEDAELTDATNGSTSLGSSNGQVLDINSILSGISSIKRHQQAISADLNALKKSNELLWEEATLARQRHDKHQDTINRILKFLAGVFGHSPDPLQKTDNNHAPGVPRTRQRLMIGDVRYPRGSKTVEIADDDDDDGNVVHAVHPQEGTKTPLAGHIASVESPLMSPTSSTIPNEAFSPAMTPGSTARTATRPTEVLSRTSTGNNSNHGSTAEVPPRTTPSPNLSHAESTLSPSALTSITQNITPASTHPDTAWQSAIQQVLNNPVQMQRLMQALASQNYPVAHPSDHNVANSQLTPYDHRYNDFSTYRSDLPVSTPVPQSSLPLLNSPLSNDDIPLLEPLLENAAHLQKTYRDAVEIEADMDVLQNSLNTLIQDMGIDPHVINEQPRDEFIRSINMSTPNGVNDVHIGDLRSNGNYADHYTGQHDGDVSSDLFLESLLHGMSATDANMDYSGVTDHYDPTARIDSGTAVKDASTDQLTAFLDEVSDTASPITHSPVLKPTTQKRKSDAAGISLPPNGTAEQAAAGPKAKRKR